VLLFFRCFNYSKSAAGFDGESVKLFPSLEFLSHFGLEAQQARVLEAIFVNSLAYSTHQE